MKARSTLLLLWALLPVFLTAQHVDLETARGLAAGFFTEAARSAEPLTPEDVRLIASSQDHPGLRDLGDDLYYIFQPADRQGFVILASEEGVAPLIGYSTDSDFRPGDMPFGLAYWLRGWGVGIDAVRSGKADPAPAAREAWRRLRQGDFFPASRETQVVDPLLGDIRWNQNPFYNDQCPLDQNIGQRTVVGCVATATAQVMKFWEYPRQGTSFHVYDHPQYGRQAAHFGATQYDWSAMPDRVTQANPEVAKLCYHVGVALEMDYGTIADGGSASYTIVEGAPNRFTAENALREFFGYSTELQGYARDRYEGDWVQLLKDDLDAGRPILYGGQGGGGGHTWVMDGYDANGLFHMNWGWDGASDGYYSIDAPDPPALGTGGGQGGFNAQQIAVVGIRPPEIIQPGLGEVIQLDTLVDVGFNPLPYTLPLIVNARLKNTDTVDFNGSIAASVFRKDNGEFLSFIEIKENQTIPAGEAQPAALEFRIDETVALVPGEYEVAILVNRGEGWVLAGNTDFDNPAQLNVDIPAEIELSEPITLNPGPSIVQGQGFSVNFSIRNSGERILAVTPRMILYDTNGDSVREIGNFRFATPLPQFGPGAGFPDLTFTVNPLDLPPGAYLLALIYEPVNEDPQLMGAGSFENPLPVNIAAAPPVPDQYENNDYFENAHIFQYTPTDGEARILTEGANIHRGTDYDYYRIDLPAGKDYTVIARVHDVAENDLGGTFTADVLWSHREDNEPPVFIFDDIHPDSFVVLDGGRLTFQVSPFFAGLTGTYELDVLIKEGVVNSLNEIGSERLKVFPNPARDHIRVVLPSETGPFQSLHLLDVSGKVVRNCAPKRMGDRQVEISVAKLPAGMYYLRGVFGRKVVSVPVMVSK